MVLGDDRTFIAIFRFLSIMADKKPSEDNENRNHKRVKRVETSTEYPNPNKRGLLNG